MSKIGPIPKDDRTKVIFETDLTVQSIDAVHQVWIWSEIKGESLIFRATDVAERDDDDLRSLLDASDLKTSGGKATISGSKSDFIFINFNFFEF